jgi:Ser/Thr protein kinase RdoA (MazF antagonist)
LCTFGSDPRGGLSTPPLRRAGPAWASGLRALALNALDQYDIDVANLRLEGVYTNTLFRVRPAAGHPCVLRVCRPGWRTATDLRSEALWLQALCRDTDIGAPEPLPARDGTLVVQASAPGVPEPRHCLLMTWIPGPLLATALSEANLFQMGVLFARLHAHGAAFVPAPGFTERRMDRVYARGEPDVLFDDASRDAFTPHTRTVLERTWHLVHAAFARLYSDRSGLQVIHHDLHHENIKLDRGRLRPFDFEDTAWGYPVQDIAMAMQDLMIAVDAAQYEPLLRAFRAGYESRAAWPEQVEGQIDTFRAGRLFWVANYVARYQRQYLRDHLDWTARLLEPFLDTGKIRI